MRRADNQQPALTEEKQDWLAIDRADPEKHGVYTEYKNITALDDIARRRLWLELAADGTVASYQQFQKSVVILPDGEVLTGKPKNPHPSVSFGTLEPIEAVQPSTTPLDDEFVARNAARVAAMKQSWLDQGHTHLLRYRTGHSSPVGAKGDMLVIDPATGDKTILGTHFHKPPAQYRAPKQPGPNM